MQTVAQQQPPLLPEASAEPPEAPTPGAQPRVQPLAVRRWPDLARLQPFGLALVSLAAGVLLWHWVTEAGLDVYINFSNVPGPVEVFTAFFEHI